MQKYTQICDEYLESGNKNGGSKREFVHGNVTEYNYNT